MHIELHSRLPSLQIATSGSKAERSVSERHQHSAVNDIHSIPVLALGKKPEPRGLSSVEWPMVYRTDEPDKSVIVHRDPTITIVHQVLLPAQPEQYERKKTIGND
ncbi:hypothetical protein [Rhizobium lusitanum]|uniref:hypothetical protein n=1 Tax=Rhizobium lusitanum TaxID=293958 RepID=UPI001FD5F3CE|nr:hypothetical protein [Rhizobium lusitanum]